MAAALPFIAVGAGAVSAYGQIKAGYDKAKADEVNASIKRQQADELLSREAINEQIMSEQAQMQAHQYGAAFAATGREGAGIGGKLRIMSDLQRSIANSKRDAEFKASLLRQGADSDMSLASDAKAAGFISGFGTLLSSGVQAYALHDKYGAPSANTNDLPGVTP